MQCGRLSERASVSEMQSRDMARDVEWQTPTPGISWFHLASSCLFQVSVRLSVPNGGGTQIWSRLGLRLEADLA